MMFLRMNICSVVLLPLLNPACSCLSMVSTASLILVIITLPSTFAATGSSVIPLQFPHSMRFPFLGRRMINPHLQSLGTLSLSQTLKNNSCNTATVVSRSTFISSEVMPSTPPAFPFFNCCTAVLISASVTGPVSISSVS